jgi:hypothetical protein
MSYADYMEINSAARELAIISPCTQMQLEQVLNALVSVLQEGVKWKDIQEILIQSRKDYVNIRNESKNNP